MNIQSIDGDFSVCQVADYSQVPLDAPFCFTGRTDDEYSLVCLTQDVPFNTVAREDGWKAFRIEGSLDFSLIGVLARIAALLAEEQISIFALSTFNTDYILVKKENEERALRRLAEQGYQIQSCGL